MASSVTKTPGYPPSKRNDDGSVSGRFTSRASTLGISAPPRGQRSQSNLRRAHTITQAQAGTTGKRMERTVVNRGKKEPTSLLRVKNSTEVLRQRSLKRSNAPPVLEVSPGIREGKHFTVGNVGNNGRIYLRPMIEPASNRAHTQPASKFSLPASMNTHLRPLQPAVARDARHSIWSTSQLSELRPDYIREESVNASDSDRRHKKAHSFSTIAEHESSTEPKEPGEFRIVIDRFEDGPKLDDQLHVPSLEVSIPHYRLGTPQFNAEGTPVLRSSIYTHTSVSDNVPSSVSFKEDADSEDTQIPSVPRLPDSLQPRQALSVAMSLFSGAAPIPDTFRHSSSTQRSAVYNLRQPIEPSIFDYLMDDMDDPSVVRYSPGSKDISAATPARIVAQISSESFMDYELVSDFFLTFRPYLSASNLLALLMARLEWAINRLQDDGRIIRIRTFAALRHWILNYFVDDFVVNRDLRTQFCDKINSMYESIKARSAGGTSDLKILVDLKRCWHGRCTLYWDCPELAGPDSLVIPGGVTGSRDIRKTRLSQVSTPNPDLVIDAELDSDRAERQPPTANTTGAERMPRPSPHMRSVSSGTAQSLPVSVSDQSFQVVSCSFPGKRSSLPLEGIKVPHPIPVQPPSSSTASNPRSPASTTARRQPFHAHKRSGSFSDSIRDDRAPLSHANTDVQILTSLPTLTSSGSLIRGNLLPPGDAVVSMTVPPSPTFLAPLDDFEGFKTRSSSEGNIKSAGASPGVRTIIGSIRRALHSRNGGHATLSHAGNGTSVTSLKGKTATVPVNVAFRSDIYRDRKIPFSSKSSLRIDFLCNQAMKDYREALGLSVGRTTQPHPGPSSQENAGHSHRSESEERQLHTSRSHHQRLPSQVTLGSKSIVIVDGTGLDLPVMSGGVPWPAGGTETSDREHGISDRSSLTEKDSSKRSEVPVAFVDHSLEWQALTVETTSLSSQPPLQRLTKSFRLNRRPSFSKSGLTSSRLRKYASYHSGITRYGTEETSEVTGSVSSEMLPGGYDRPLSRMLRRRPGGDLRKIQNVHDLEPHLRPQSFVSETSLTDSVPTSAFPYAGRSYLYASHARAVSTPPRFSLINTHSSQHLRPSFEAAVAQFSRIPDDDDGGIESTLLKLEGKWQSKSPTPAESPLGLQNGGEIYHYGEMEPIQQQEAFNLPGNADGAQIIVGQREVTPQLYTDSMIESEYSYSSIPLLERGLSDESMKKPKTRSVLSNTTMPRPLFSRDASKDTTEPESSHPSIQIVDETESIRRIPVGSTIPTPTAAGEDTIDHEGDRLSDLSSELSVDVIEKDDAFENLSKASKESQCLGIAALDIPLHPLAHPPSPPMTIQHVVPSVRYARPATPVSNRMQPLTPGPSPSRKIGASNGVVRKVEECIYPEDQLQSAHVPFILACESHVLAQQLTLVEKAALDEVDWKDLVEMKWNHNSSSAVNWVQYLAEQERKGIDLVVGRFNLMVKWVLSEIILTRDLYERARTITKFIHVAAHAKRMCNYSTMLQIAIALSSVDCTRLQRTWALVIPADKHTLEGMESLIQPVRNFHELRVEMETANLQDGCIPFVGLYVHDLTYNAQKPSQIAGTRDGDALVNFERYRTTARIVKCLLRLIDASNKYSLEPVPGVIERCLWIASLSDEKIQAFSKSLE